MPEKEKKDIEYLIEKDKKEMSDYISVCHKIGLPQSVIDKRLDFYLDNLSMRLKKLKELNDSELC